MGKSNILPFAGRGVDGNGGGPLASTYPYYTLEEPNQLDFSWTLSPDALSYRVLITEDDSLNVILKDYNVANNVSSDSFLASEIGSPIVPSTHIRVYAIADKLENLDSIASPVEAIFNASTPLTGMITQATVSSNNVDLAYNYNITNLDTVIIERRTLPSSTWETIGIEASPTGSYNDSTAVNGSQYEYRVMMVPNNYNNLVGYSNIVQASPTASQPTLSDPIILSVLQLTNTTTRVTFSNPEFATLYVPYLDGVAGTQTILGAGPTEHIFTTTVGDIGVQKTFGVKCIDGNAVYLDSAISSVNYTPYDIDNADESVFESFGADDYYKPLDGRVLESNPGLGAFPLMNITPYDNLTPTEVDYLNNTLGYAGTNYSKVETSISGVLESEDEGKLIFAMNCHRTLPTSDATYKDLYYPGVVSGKYAEVLHFDAVNDCIYIDELINGGDRDVPISVTDKMGYIFTDNSTAWAAWMANLGSSSTPYTGRTGQVYSYSGSNYRVRGVYVVREPKTFTPTGSNTIKIYTGTTEKAIIKIGVEDYYNAENSLGSTYWTNNQILFNIASLTGTSNFITHNIVYAPVHRIFRNGNPFQHLLFSGSSKDDGVIASIGNEIFIEKFDIDNGDAPEAEKYELNQQLKRTFITNGGTYSGSGLLKSADKVLDIYDRGGRYNGSNCHSNHNAEHAHRDWCVDSNFNNAASGRWANTNSEYNTTINGKSVNNFSDFHSNYETAYNEGWLPLFNKLNITDGSAWNNLAQGGNNRYNCINIGKWVFYLQSQALRYSDFTSYFKACFRKSTDSDISFNDRTQSPTLPNSVLMKHAIGEVGQKVWTSIYFEGGTRGSSTDLYSCFEGYKGVYFSLYVADTTGFINNELVTVVPTSGDTLDHYIRWVKDGNKLEMQDAQGNTYNGRPDYSGATITGVDSGTVATVYRYESMRKEIPLIKQLYTHCMSNIVTWPFMANKFVNYFSDADKDNYVPSNGMPFSLQPGDTFKITPYIVVKDINNIVEGDTITQNVSGAQAEVDKIAFTRVRDHEYETQNWLEYNGTPTHYEQFYTITLKNIVGTWIDTEDITNGTGGDATLHKAYNHDPALTYTVKFLQRQSYPYPAISGLPKTSVKTGTDGGVPFEIEHSEYSASNVYGFYYILNAELPTNLPVVYEIEILSSAAEVMINEGVTRPARQKYIGNGRIRGYYRYTADSSGTTNGWGEAQNFGDSPFTLVEGGRFSHIAYSQSHITYYFKNCDVNGFWRQNYRKPSKTNIEYPAGSGNTTTVVPHSYYQSNVTLLNMRSSFTGQFANGEEGSQDMSRRRILEDYFVEQGLGDWVGPIAENDRAKLRSLGGVATSIAKFVGTTEYVRAENINPTPGQEDSEPALPQRILDIEASLPGGGVSLTPPNAQISSGNESVTITYEPHLGISSVTFFFKESVDVAFTEVGTLPPTGTLGLTTLTNGTSYDFQLRYNTLSGYAVEESEILTAIPN